MDEPIKGVAATYYGRMHGCMWQSLGGCSTTDIYWIVSIGLDGMSDPDRLTIVVNCMPARQPSKESAFTLRHLAPRAGSTRPRNAAPATVSPAARAYALWSARAAAANQLPLPESSSM